MIHGPVGILALQGASKKHVDMLAHLGVESFLVKQPQALRQCAALIIPGGESTTMSVMMQREGFYPSIREFAQHRPMMGVCAGMVMMASEVDDDRVKPLGTLPLKILRNYYGRQRNSFSTRLSLNYDAEGSAYPAHFIRAPAVGEYADEMEVLAEYGNEPVMLAMGPHLVAAFHPELTDDTRIHEYWLRKISQ